MNIYDQHAKLNERKIFEKGIIINNMLLYFKDLHFYIEKNYLRCFKFSIKRAKFSLNINSDNDLFKILLNCINDIKIEKKNDNLFFLIVMRSDIKIKDYILLSKIKLKEINNYLIISNSDDPVKIINKQKNKISVLLKKIEEFENRQKQLLTDDEFL
jgi:hypothetical protein